ncbi:MAG: sulfatase-like hydrolase/transferase [Muribaculaceae bacterium]|nr:sulfatase-like hydrolase/transferase [Muribaculaceae bacterium]
MKNTSLLANLKKQPGFIMLVNFLVMMAIYMLSRWFFYYMNINSFKDVTLSEMMSISWGGLRFDACALCYLNALCILLQFLPIKCRHTAVYQKVVKILFIVFNALGIAVNVADIAYFEFGGRRTTATIFSEFGGESNLGTIFANSIITYWQVWLFGAIMIAALFWLYYNPIKRDLQREAYSGNSKRYYLWHSLIFIIAGILTVSGMRGGLAWKMHPLRQDSACLYCKRPHEAAIVLNTPFTLITTAHKKGYVDPKFFDPNQLDSIFNPIRNTQPRGGEMQKLNVVVFIMESFSMEYTGFFNKDKDGGRYQGYTPFLDQLLSKSYCFDYSFANGIRSVDCMPASFAGIPRYINPYCYYVYSNNTLQGLPQMLKDEGYTTAFFHGAPNSTLGFQSFANLIGFEHYYGMDEYPGKDDFDGTWAIFDEPYLQYFADMSNQIASRGKPFMLTVFTASSHDPFRIPDQHKATFTRGDIPMHKAISYSDYSIQQYFEKVKSQPWFKNTIFVFTADHCGVNHREDYNNNMGRFLIPIFFYTPGGQLPANRDSERLMQQTDITPTLLGLLNYQKPYFSFGKDVFDQSPSHLNYVFNDRNGTSMYYLDSLMIEYNADQLIGIYDFKNDFSLKNNLINQKSQFPQLPLMQRQMEAILQQYVERMKQDRLTAK